MEIVKENEIAAWAGWDWADQKHVVCLKLPGNHPPEFFELKHRDIQQWAGEMLARFGGQKIAIAIEQSRGAAIYELMQVECFVLFPINTATISNYRKALRSSGAKDDPFDSELLADFLVTHFHRLRAWKPDDALTMKLRPLVEYRRKFVDDASSIGRRMQAVLKLYYPQSLEWLTDLKSPLACDFLTIWGSPGRAQKATPERLRKFFYSHNCRNSQYIETRICQIRSCQPHSQNETIASAYSKIIECLVQQMRTLLECIASLDAQITDTFANHPDRAIYESLPGAGPVLAPRLAVALGVDRDRYESAVILQQFSGIAPVTDSSGNSRWVHWRWACPKFMRQTFVEFAACSLPFCTWARECYQRQKNRGKSHHAALRVVAYKWQRVLFRCWKDCAPYNEEKHLCRLNKIAVKNQPKKQIALLKTT